jgi:glucosamine-6-phosphate deaminase
MAKAQSKKENSEVTPVKAEKSDKAPRSGGKSTLSNVERVALERSGYDLLYPPQEKVPTIVVPNFPLLGKLAAVRFLEWVLQHPEGVVSLPTGKTPEHFIKFVQHFVKNWDKKETRKTLADMGLDTETKPVLSGLRFVQIDEFYPIDTKQHNSFFYYVNKFYLRGFGLDPDRALLINPSKIGIPAGRTIEDVFPEMTLDLSLRVRRARSLQEKRQQEVLKAVDQFCTDYEARLREMGGIGFFLGGIGPDGHIAFNVRGTDLYSTTRLTEPNYETQAAAAGDLGGIEVSRARHVITIGLNTIVYNPNVAAIVIAAGEAKAGIVADTIQSEPSNIYPGSILSTVPNGRFYITHGAMKKLSNRMFVDFQRKAEADMEDVNRVVMDISMDKQKPVASLTNADFQGDRWGVELLRKTGRKPDDLRREVGENILSYIDRGIATVEDKTYLHTAPHHDDIILAYLPYFTNLVRRASTKHFFTYLTSGFNAVTNDYMLGAVRDLRNRIERGQFDDLLKTDYFDPNNERGRDLDTTHFLQGSARERSEQMDEAVARRMLRNLIELYEDEDITNLMPRLAELQNYFETQYPGKKDIHTVQMLKGRMREFESDRKWAYYGFRGKEVRHLRLGFYKGDIFTEAPTLDRDVPPIVNLLMETKPDYVTVAFDPEGSGPDTHYKVLQAVSAALKVYEQKTGNSDIRVLGYRNVWFRFHPSEANLYVPTTLRHLNDMAACFDVCFTTQRTASFPSPELDGPFSKVARKVQVKQMDYIRTFLGEDYFLNHTDHGVRAATAMVFLRDMSLEEFYSKSDELRSLAE